MFWVLLRLLAPPRGTWFYSMRLSRVNEARNGYVQVKQPPLGGHVIGTIIGAIVIGLIVGGLARLIMPGKQNIGVVMTVILGAIGAFLGTWVSYKLGYSNQNGGFKIIPFLVGIVFACILIGIYLGVTGRRITNRLGRR
jgi:uncharacterized membrane protein YeaQ/YmgE (transglycosylase-associated protein family)